MLWSQVFWLLPHHLCEEPALDSHLPHKFNKFIKYIWQMNTYDLDQTCFGILRTTFRWNRSPLCTLKINFFSCEAQGMYNASCRITQEVNPCGNDGPGGWNCPMKCLVTFIHVSPLKKSNFQALWYAARSSRSCCENTSFKMGNSDIKPLSSTLCLNVVSYLCVPCEDSTSMSFGTAYEVMSYPWKIFTQRTIK